MLCINSIFDDLKFKYPILEDKQKFKLYSNEFNSIRAK